MTETLFVYLSATASFIFLCVGVFAGWTVNEKMHEYLYTLKRQRTRDSILKCTTRRGNGSTKNSYPSDL